MRYLVLIYGSEQRWTSMTPEQAASMMSEYMAYSKSLADAGVMRGGDELQPTFTATTIRMRDGERLTTDGPFAETKEQLGGYYLIETETLDEAIAWAGKCPGVHGGSVEVRPVVQREKAGGAEQAVAASAAGANAVGA